MSNNYFNNKTFDNSTGITSTNVTVSTINNISVSKVAFYDISNNNNSFTSYYLNATAINNNLCSNLLFKNNIQLYNVTTPNIVCYDTISGLYYTTIIPSGSGTVSAAYSVVNVTWLTGGGNQTLPDPGVSNVIFKMNVNTNYNLFPISLQNYSIIINNIGAAAFALYYPSGYPNPGTGYTGVASNTIQQYNYINGVWSAYTILSSLPSISNVPLLTVNNVFTGTNTITLDTSSRVAISAGTATNSVAIGVNAGKTSQAANTIILNASGVETNGISAQTNSFYVNPIRLNAVTPPNFLSYDATNKEVYYTTTMPTVTVANVTVNTVIQIGTGATTGAYGTAIGGSANAAGQLSIALGSNSASAGTASIGIGYLAGQTGLGINSVAIGQQAGQLNLPANCICLNASGAAVNGVASQVSSFYVAPIRANNINPVNLLCYDITTKEITSTNTLFAYAYYYNSANQAIPTSTETIVIFPFSSRTFGTLGITYSAGVFTNTSGGTILISVSAQYVYSNTNSIGNRNNYLSHSVLGYLSSDNTTASYYTGAPVANLSCTFTMLTNETFRFLTNQDSGVSLNIAVNGSTIQTFCSITRLS